MMRCAQAGPCCILSRVAHCSRRAFQVTGCSRITCVRRQAASPTFEDGDVRRDLVSMSIVRELS